MAALLQAHEVSIAFGGVTAVDHVSFEVQPGEIFGLIGPNGAGKTTLMNLISRLLPLSGGKITFRDREIGGLRPDQIAGLGIARTFQIVQPLVGLTVLENVMVGSLFRKGEGGRPSVRDAAGLAERVLDRVGLAKDRDLPVTSLTLGKKKRLELAKALAMRPALLLLDEIMAGLNPAEVQETMALIKEIRDGGVSIIVIEHVMQAIMNLCDRVMVLHHGKCIRIGQPAEVAHDPTVIEAYLGKRHTAMKGAASS